MKVGGGEEVRVAGGVAMLPAVQIDPHHRQEAGPVDEMSEIALERARVAGYRGSQDDSARSGHAVGFAQGLQTVVRGDEVVERAEEEDRVVGAGRFLEGGRPRWPR